MTEGPAPRANRPDNPQQPGIIDGANAAGEKGPRWFQNRFVIGAGSLAIGAGLMVGIDHVSDESTTAAVQAYHCQVSQAELMATGEGQITIEVSGPNGPLDTSGYQDRRPEARLTTGNPTEIDSGPLSIQLPLQAAKGGSFSGSVNPVDFGQATKRALEQGMDSRFTAWLNVSSVTQKAGDAPYEAHEIACVGLLTYSDDPTHHALVVGAGY